MKARLSRIVTTLVAAADYSAETEAEDWAVMYVSCMCTQRLEFNHIQKDIRILQVGVAFMVNERESKQ